MENAEKRMEFETGKELLVDNFSNDYNNNLSAMNETNTRNSFFEG